MLIQLHPSNAVITSSFLENWLTIWFTSISVFTLKLSSEILLENNINENNHCQRGKELRGWGVEKGEGSSEVQTSRCKMNKPQRCKVQYKEYG